MSTEQLEQRLAAVEEMLAEVQRKLDVLNPAEPQKPWWERIGRLMTPEQEHGFSDAMAYAKYFRMTGQDPPPGWKPGDPIPEPDPAP